MSGAHFDILSRETEIERPYFLEASAGTGKTFAIEHLVVRYLLELDPPVTIDRILVVTFTRAATRELRLRIRRNIERALGALESGEAPDYLMEWIDEGREGEARQRLGQALAAFDDAQIYTIHAFCREMLREYAVEAEMGIDTEEQEGGLSHADQLQVVLDFFRSGLEQESYSPAQISRALTLTRGDPGGLARLILKEMGRGREVIVGRGYRETVTAVNGLLGAVDVSAADVLEDFSKFEGLYKGLCDRNRQLKPEIEEEVYRFATILERGSCSEGEFERLVTEPIVLLDLIANGQLLRGKEFPSDLRHPWLYRWLREEFGPVMEEGRNPRQILARMVATSRHMLGRTMEEQESLTFDGLLRAMGEALERDRFRQAVGDRFAAAVVDEFQDTDPTQWKIFNRLFAERGVPLVVVGDPKQSIYSFRSADIYSYLEARDVLGEESCRTLGVNYRSRPGLISALNGLFGRAEGLIGLPARGTSLPYLPVEAGVKGDNSLSASGPITIFEGESRAARKFPSLATEEEQLFPFILGEMIGIRQASDVPFSHFAVLISDRYQGERFRQFAVERGVPVTSSRGRRAADSPALEQLYVVYRAVLDPSDWGRVRAALGGQLIGWDVPMLAALADGKRVAMVATEMAMLRNTLMSRGFLPFFHQLITTTWGGKKAVGERLIRADEELSRDLYQLAEIIARHENSNQVSADGLLPYFHELRTMDAADEQGPKLLAQSDDDAVHLMTTFASKGLEFGVVFALGLATRKGGSEAGLVVRKGERLAASYESEEAADLAAAERDAEKARLLYVALTRAKDRVYIPHVVSSGKPSTLSSPADLLFSRLPTDLSELEGVRVISAVGGGQREVAPQPPPELTEPPTPSIYRVNSVMQSFTGLARRKIVRGNPAPFDREVEIKTVHTLPAGAATGILLHELLEEAPLDPVEARQFVVDRMGGHALAGWSEIIGDLVAAALQVSIDGFSLSDVDPRRMRREMEFLYGVRGTEPVSLDPGCVGGVMDLFFEHNGLYYLLDWKSNWLGADRNAYGEEGLAAAMVHHDYGLQAKLYTEALERYLGLVDERPFDECFGGAYYVFLRGPGVIKWN